MSTDLEAERTYAATTKVNALLPVFALSLFTSAARLFWVQPLVVRMFLIAFICHCRLALGHPDVARLPEYYLWIAGGGVLGGPFNALLTAVIFSTSVEYPIAIVLGCLVRPAATQDKSKSLVAHRLSLPDLFADVRTVVPYPPI